MAGRIMKIEKNFNDPIGNVTQNFPTCSLSVRVLRIADIRSQIQMTLVFEVLFNLLIKIFLLLYYLANCIGEIQCSLELYNVCSPALNRS
jgi:hypothetical protein